MPAERRRRPWLITLPLVFFLVLAALWTAAWFYVRGEVEARLDVLLANEASAGRPHECPQRSVTGYPFLIEVRCVNPRFVIATPQGPARIRLAAVTVGALVYNPRHIIVDMTAPLAVEHAGADIATVGFSRGQASVRMSDLVAERVSLVLDRATLTLRAAARPDVVAERVELHARHDPTVAAPVRDFELNVLARGLATAGLRPEQGANLDAAGTLRRWPLMQAPGPQGPIADWARAGGTFELREARLTRGTGLMRLGGSIGFTETGYANGQLNAILAEPGALLAGLTIPGVGEASAFLGPALTLVGRRTEFEGRRATEVLVRLDGGALSIGAVQLAVFPPVF